MGNPALSRTLGEYRVESNRIARVAQARKSVIYKTMLPHCESRRHLTELTALSSNSYKSCFDGESIPLKWRPSTSISII